MPYRMYDTKNNLIMSLSYKPNLFDLIRNDDTGMFYNVVDINTERKFCIARRNYEMEQIQG
ncbi:hypothetical protein D7M11_02050 [Paenibacillus ginsengarvi]|uniref:Uncharacterized protein n=1 Tax=Paenibacillus ginsengarvi TaxID=400777 RepID=A0A3B0CMZ0_9BACL|nr:hypothetical protein D7M11_02050 [Paenibacillus ginsengarvi]